MTEALMLQQSLQLVLDKWLDILRNSHAYGTYWPSFQSPFLENMGVVLFNKGYQMIELFILLQLILYKFWHQIRI